FLIARYFLVHAGYEFLNYPSFCDEEGYPLSTPMRKNNHALALAGDKGTVMELRVDAEMYEKIRQYLI
ncbi:MAG: hypothetical protein IJP94_08505, partial [Clostridia bacterium]|nr:hypothetical protein [Clostridia bacterium]